jgi:hypothetical protein
VAADPLETRDVQQEGGEESERALEESPANGGVPDQHPAIAAKHRHAAEREVGIDRQGFGGLRGLVHEVEAAEPVEGVEDACRASAEPALAVVEAGVPMGCVRGHGKV